MSLLPLLPGETSERGACYVRRAAPHGAGRWCRVRIANEALVRLLADALDLPRSGIQLVRGKTSRHKVVALTGLTAEAVMARLFPA